MNKQLNYYYNASKDYECSQVSVNSVDQWPHTSAMFINIL